MHHDPIPNSLFQMHGPYPICAIRFNFKTRSNVGTTPITITILRAQVGDLQELIKEKDRHIDTLKIELEKAGQDKEAIQNLYSNYMLQMQTLINQKAIEAPGAKKPWWRFW